MTVAIVVELLGVVGIKLVPIVMAPEYGHRCAGKRHFATLGALNPCSLQK
jgi:hypothetical protein